MSILNYKYDNNIRHSHPGAACTCCHPGHHKAEHIVPGVQADGTENGRKLQKFVVDND